ncbi:MAG: hypothetical protein PVH88_10740 [Ignavibacteria bacterium]|jgi:hypothetical protein
MKWFSITSIFTIYLLSNIFLFSSAHENDTASVELQLGEGLCIYPVNTESYPEHHSSEVNVADVEITGDALISYEDIIKYDTAAHVITLALAADSLGISYGTPFLVTLDKEKIYGGWFFAPSFSSICDWVVIDVGTPFDSLESNQVKITLGYPGESFFKGIDPRNNSKIIQRLILDGKAE